MFNPVTGQIILSEAEGTGFAARTRYYAILDAQGNVTAIVGDLALGTQTSPQWQVIERYSYTPYGQVETLDQNWVPEVHPSVVPIYSVYGWDLFYHGMRLSAAAGLYISTSGAAYDPFLGKWQQAATPGWGIPSTSTTTSGVGSGWSGAQMDAGTWTNTWNAFTDPSSFGSAYATTVSPTVQAWSNGFFVAGAVFLTIGSGGLAAQWTTAAMGAEFAGTFSGAVISNAIAGGVSAGVGNALGQYASGQPFNPHYSRVPGTVGRKCRNLNGMLQSSLGCRASTGFLEISLFTVFSAGFSRC